MKIDGNELAILSKTSWTGRAAMQEAMGRQAGISAAGAGER